MKLIVELDAKFELDDKPMSPEEVRDWLQYYALNEEVGYETSANIAEDPHMQEPDNYKTFYVSNVKVEVVP